MPADGEDKLDNRVLETANRLRLIQVDFADQNEQTRTEYLCEEIERVLKTILPGERKEFLEKLMARFPTGNLAGQQLPAKGDGASGAKTGLDKLADTDFLVSNLLEAAPRLTDEQKRIIGERLQQGQATARVQGACPEEAVQRLKAALKLGDELDVHDDRLAELLVLLTNFACRLDPLVWNTWRALSPRSDIRKPGDLAGAMGQFVSGEPEASPEQVEKALKELQRLTAAIITAVSRVGGQFARQHLTKFTPSEIEAQVRMERGSVFQSHDVKCWRKYTELADLLNEDSIDTAIRRAVVEYVQSLMRGMGR
jgi:hypothetical protein